MIDLKYRCVIWGISDEYEKIINVIKFEEILGNLKVVALVCRKEDRYSLKHDGYPVILKEDLKSVSFDLLIIANENRYDEISNEFKANVDNKWNGVICKARAFLLPNFNIHLYINLLKHPITLISNDCWGGLLYNRLGLKFSSPFINTYILANDYVKIFNNPLYYLSQELCFYRESDYLAGEDPMGTLGKEDKLVKIHFPHYLNFEEAEAAWKRRFKRININRLFLKANCFAKDNIDLSLFKNNEFSHIIFTDKKTFDPNRNDVFICKRRMHSIFEYFRNEIRVHSYSQFEINYLKLLNGCKPFSREC